MEDGRGDDAVMILGVDVGAPRRARDQRRKIVAIAAGPTGPRAYRVDVGGMNERLLASPRAPGWTARELVDELGARPARVIGLDVPFGIPRPLLDDPAFAASVGRAGGAFGDWPTFNAWIAAHLPLADPLDFAPFAAWRDPAARSRLWTRRATDIAAGAQPPLKDRFQSTFQMTLLGNAILAALVGSGHYRIPPFSVGAGASARAGAGELVEVYPRATLRAMGLAAYKSRPDESVRLGVAACTAAGITLDIDPRIVTLACRYSSGTTRSPDFDVADALVALCTAVLHGERATRMAMPEDGGDLAEYEGAIRVPA